MFNKIAATLSRDKIRFWQSCDLEPLLSQSGEEVFVARRVLANRMILLAKAKAQDSGQLKVAQGLEKAHQGIACGGEVKDIFNHDSWENYLDKYIKVPFTIVLTSADTGLSREVTLSAGI